MRPASKSTDTAGHYDGTPPWEAYLARFCLAALANSWNPGKVLQVLLDLDPEEPCDFHTLSTALQHPFGKVEPTVGLCHRLATRKRTSGKKLGLLPADARYLTRQGYLGYPSAVQEDLTMEAFVRGLNPTTITVFKSRLKRHFYKMDFLS
ncbi:UNVERIFIED_CONTAM: hypothetical protein FKN15_053479 [Acipenser sinensis]